MNRFLSKLQGKTNPESMSEGSSQALLMSDDDFDKNGLNNSFVDGQNQKERHK